MKPIRQHILPRFLIKGFASRVVANNIFTWLYQAGGRIFETNIINVSVEKYFYGRNGEHNADINITNIEGQFASLLTEIRELRNNNKIIDQKIPEFVAHLIIRTKHVREGFRASVDFLIEEMSRYVDNYDNIRTMLYNNPELLRDNLEKTLKKIQAPKLLKDKMRPLLIKILPNYLENQKDEIQMMFHSMIQTTKNILPKAINEGHIKGLAREPIPEPRVDDYRKLQWFIYISEEPLILGDFGCLFEIIGPKRFKTITFKNDEIKNVFLPVSDTHLLIGTSLFEYPSVNPIIINQEIAKCSRDYFVCSKYSQDKADLLSIIGAEAEIISREEIGNIVKNIFKGKKAKF